MDDMFNYAMEIHMKGDDELNNRSIEILDYLLRMGVDPDMITAFCSINNELTIRAFRKNLGLS